MDCARRSLKRNGEPLTLTSKTFDLLQQLVENHGSVLSKDELLDRVWPGQFVEENNLSVQISALRRVFGDKNGAYRFITTVPGKGYSFIETVKRSGNEGSTDANAAPQRVSPANLYEGESVFGRSEEIAEIKSLLQSTDDGARLIILTGAGGCGKTKLAQAVAGELSADFPDGVWFVELAAVNNEELLALTVAVALGVEESSETTPVESLKNFLSERRMLLILDNFEQLISAASFIKEIIASSPSLKILVTSRVALRLSNEREFEVRPLSVPPKDIVLSAEQLNDYAAVRLFVARAKSSKKNFAMTEENASSVAEICRRLDGLPLAIELAAPRVKLLSVQSILSRLENSLQLLTGGAHDMPERQRTMRGTIEWSYDLLDEAEKIMFRRLAVFAGGFTVEAAETIAEEENARKREQSSPIDVQSVSSSTDLGIAASALDLLGSLLDNNLLVSKEQTDGSSRLQMLEVVREFAFEMLGKTGELDDLLRIHAQLFLSLADEAEPFLYGEKGIEWLARLENEHDNFRAALSWCLKNEPETAARITASLSFFWFGHSHFSEGLGWCNAALQVTENNISEARAKILLQISIFLRHRGEFEAARKITEKCLAESRELNDTVLIQKAVHGLGCIAAVQKDYSSAESYYLEALALSRNANDERRIAYTLGSLGDLEMCKGNHSAARVFLEECRVLSEKLGDRPVQTTIYYNLGAIDYFEGLYQKAALKFARSLRICKEMGFKSMMSCALDGFAALAAVGGNFELSARLAGVVDSLRESISYNNEPAEEAFRDDYLTKVHTALDENEFAAQYELGKTMNLDEALGLVVKRPRLEDGQSPDYGHQNGDFYLTDELTEVVIQTRRISRVIIEEETASA
ncbi:MAG: winged helix-turn-helix domain-containing protein [Chloracidobacterium sp.]|nr:winged helix-turn-helix domain-containing protein [Chloracidobacterium sp.]